MKKMRLMSHRGGSFEADENTMGAFRYSYDHGLRAFETDVRMTQDGQLAILHDDTLDRTTDGHGPLESLTADELRAVRTKKSGEPVPFLSDVLAFLRERPGTFAELEMKTGKYPDADLPRYCRLLADQARAALATEAFTLTSFDQRPLKIVKELAPELTTTLICGGKPDEAFVAKAKDLGCTRIGVIMDVTTRRFVREAKQAGFTVIGWPTQSEADAELAAALDVDFVTTDIPVRLMKGGYGAG